MLSPSKLHKDANKIIHLITALNDLMLRVFDISN